MKGADARRPNISLLVYPSNGVLVKTIKTPLEKFSRVSELYPSLSKSTMFYGSLNEDEKQQILNILPFKSSGKVKQKLNDWKNKSLSYAGRSQLIASVMSSMQVYWGSVLKLPIAIVKEIESLFKGFLWCNGELTREKARVAWKKICQLKGQGGWKTILELRQMVVDHVRFKSDNEKKISAWYDRWNENHALAKSIKKREVHLAGFNDQSKLCDVIDANK
ncbi:hypothetical protein Tco_1025727 [Tanacetum coccineum]